MYGFLFLPALLLAADAPGVDLTGTISTRDGKPIAGAHVVMYTAGPRRGVNLLCPSCYPDCQKRAQTDAQGKFVVPQLDRELIFTVVVIAAGHQPVLLKSVDPLQDPLTAALSALPGEIDSQRIIRGRVVDAKGSPIVAAKVEPFGIRTSTNRWWGTTPGVDPVAVTNLRGEFVLTSEEPGVSLDLKVRSREHAPRNMELLPAGEDHEIVLQHGGCVRGRLLNNGRPVTGYPLGIVHRDRSAGKFLGHAEIGTNDEGEFEFSNLAQNETYYLFNSMAGSDHRGTLAICEVQLGADKKLVDVGDLSLDPSFRLSGRVVLTDGNPIPRGTRIGLFRELAWDHQFAEVDGAGRFAFDSVPEEAVSMLVRIPGYRLAANRNRFQQTRANTLATFVDKDRVDVEIFYEPDPAAARRKPAESAPVP